MASKEDKPNRDRGPQRGGPTKTRLQTFLWWVMIIAIFAAFMQTFQTNHGEQKSYDAFIADVKAGSVKKAVVSEDSIKYYQRGSDTKAYTVERLAREQDGLIEMLSQQPDMELFLKPDSGLGAMLLTWIVPLVFLGLLFLFMTRQMGRTESVLSFGRSRARIVAEKDIKTTFDDVAGCDEAKEELHEIADFLRNPTKYSAVGGKIPKGVLLVGPPGCGKTLIARAVAGEAGVPFFSISGSDFVEMFVGVGAARVRDLFAQAKAKSPCIIFIDEIDAVGRQRGAGIGGGHDEREQTLNQLLVEMDGFESEKGTIILAATNRPDVLDPALLRPGRFDRRVVIDQPDQNGRHEIFRVHTREKPLSDDVDLRILAKRTPGFAGADIANVANEAALLAARRGRTRITMHDFEDAVERVVAGPERKSRIISDKEKRILAHHELGHAITAIRCKHADPVHKVSIIPRGHSALGYTLQLPIEDKYIISREELIDRITSLMGGRAAEEIVFNQKSTGAQNDLERASDIARQMVVKLGMGEHIGPVHYGQKEHEVFLGRDLAYRKDFSEEIAVRIDQEVEGIVRNCYDRARKVLERDRELLGAIAERLVTEEVLDGRDLREVIDEYDRKRAEGFEAEESARLAMKVLKPLERPAKKVVEEPAKNAAPSAE